MKMDLRTEGQKSRAQRDAAICEAYQKIRGEQPLVTRNRILVAVARDFGLVSQTVKVILIKHGIYER